MAKFVYRMQNILELKQKIEEQEKANFGMATARFNEEQQKLRDLMIKQAGYERQLKELSVGNIDIKAIKTTKSAITSMKVALRDQMIEVSKAQKAMENARKKLNAVMMERKMHEKLREHAFEEFLNEVDYEENKITDEIVSSRFFNAENEGE
ncbi:flagellar export protein FliJ [Pseudobutyrivibrio xylanivorans]|uniref:Flagellar FliJ protein n=1 Tax=Pseudobutyrivibrio xylanivorans TaxID=185007 RepID=A0A5P6VUN9_PSEXY|nr:flagellar export protein FliJ [Pseudobutyrivibrio xylanivorans]QFJ55479.1 flagellar export protein FliJ [Pseudobutyrivibrio xylanivorans]